MQKLFRFLRIGPDAGPETSIVLDRRGRDVWLVPNGPVGGITAWHPTREGSLVRVPLFRYVTQGRQPEVAMAYAFELGLSVVLEAPIKPSKILVAFGSPVVDLSTEGGPDSFAFWVGVALIQ